MLRLVLLLSGIAVVGCAQYPPQHSSIGPTPPGRAAPDGAPSITHAPNQPHRTSSSHPITKSDPIVPGASKPSLQRIIPLTYHRTSRHGVTLSMVSFDSREHQLRVADQQKGPGTRWTDSKSCAATYRGLAAINGGFFTPEGKPLGLLIETGSKRGYINKSSLGAGMLVFNKTGSSIIRREQYNASSIAANAYNLLQTGPMLSERSKPVPGLSRASSRPRSFIAWDGKNHWAIGYAEPCTLDALSRALAGASPAGFKIHTAVNLDGGRSSDLWVGPLVKNGNKTHRTFLNKTVRNYLVLIPR